MRLAHSFQNPVSIRRERPLTDDEIRKVAPSIFAEEAHGSRSDRYTHIPTIDVITGLRANGFEPFMACQTNVRDDDLREHTKHMLRLRQPGQIAGKEANEVILLNSSDGSSSYQLVAGMFRFVCSNGLVSGEHAASFRVPHKGDIVDNVIEGAIRVVDTFELIEQKRDEMAAVLLSAEEQTAFATSAIALRYQPNELRPAPVTEASLLAARRFEDRSADLWTTFNKVQENLIMGNVPTRAANGRRTRTRAVTSIKTNVDLNRGLWALAEAMKKLKA